MYLFAFLFMEKQLTHAKFGLKIDYKPYKPLYDFSFIEEVFKLEILRCANFVGMSDNCEVVKIYTTLIIHGSKLHNYKSLISANLCTVDEVMERKPGFKIVTCETVISMLYNDAVSSSKFT
jgi:hypothetical protein